MKKFILTITYSFDTDYYTKSFNNEEDAIKELNKILDKEVTTTKKEFGFTPSIIKYSDIDVALIYEQDCQEDYFTNDRTYYKVFEVEL